MRLPGGESAVIPPGKLLGYALNSDHPRGREKARVYQAALGIGPAQVGILEAALLQAAKTVDATLIASDIHGDVYRIEFVLEYLHRAATIRSGWLVPADGSRTRLTMALVRRRSE